MPRKEASLPEGAIPYAIRAQKVGLGAILQNFFESGDPVLVWDESEILQYGSKTEEQAFATRKNILVGSIRRSLGHQTIPSGLEYKIMEDPARREIYLVKES